MQTSVWSKKDKVCIDEVYTRLSMVKGECNAGCEVGCEGKHSVPATSWQLFNELKNGRETKRILVDGQAGIGKSTFVTKLSLDWIECVKETNPLKKFKLVLLIKLREVSHCKTLEEVLLTFFQRKRNTLYLICFTTLLRIRKRSCLSLMAMMNLPCGKIPMFLRSSWDENFEIVVFW